MSIGVITGPQRSGKTIFAVWHMGQFVQAGRFVATDIRLRPECPFYDQVALLDDDEGKYPVLRGRPGDPDYLMFLHYLPEGSVVFLDEPDANGFDCLDHGKQGDEMPAALKQIGKMKMDVFFVTQNVENLYNRIRRQATSWIECEWTYRSSRLIRFAGKRWSRFIHTEFDSERKKIVTSSGHWKYEEATKMFGWYDTAQQHGSFGVTRRKVLKGMIEKRKALESKDGAA